MGLDLSHLTAEEKLARQRAQSKAWRAANLEHHREYMKAWREKNREHRRDYAKARYADPKKRAKIRAQSKSRYEAHRRNR